MGLIFKNQFIIFGDFIVQYCYCLFAIVFFSLFAWLLSCFLICKDI